MNAASILTELLEKLKITKYSLNKRLGLKSKAHIYLMLSGDRKPNIPTCRKIIELGKKYDMDITLDMLRGES